MRLFSGKKGYFFVIDSLVAMTILSVGLFVLVSSFSVSPPKTQVIITSKDALSYITETTIKRYVDKENILNKSELLERGSLDNTIIEQVMEFIYLNQNQTAEDLLRTSLGEVVPIQHNVRIMVDSKVIYMRSISEPDEAELLIPSKSYAITIYNTSHIIGPSLIEVDVWQ